MTRRAGQAVAPQNACSGQQIIRLSWSLEVLTGSLANENRSSMPLLFRFPVCSRLFHTCTVRRLHFPLFFSYIISHRSFFWNYILCTIFAILSFRTSTTPLIPLMPPTLRPSFWSLFFSSLYPLLFSIFCFLLFSPSRSLYVHELFTVNHCVTLGPLCVSLLRALLYSVPNV